MLIEIDEATILPVVQATEPDPDIGFAVNARIHPAGLPATWHVEYGRTSAYGSSTPPRALPGKLAAHYVEAWTEGTNGWEAGLTGHQLSHQPAGGPPGGHVRYTADGTFDANHGDGIGVIQRPLHGDIAAPVKGPRPSALSYLGGGRADLRGARISLRVRGVEWVGKGTKLGTWIQVSHDTTQLSPSDQSTFFANWAHTGDDQAKHLRSGTWKLARWTLRNSSHQWTYAGGTGGRHLYKELDASLGDIDHDIFPLQLLYVDPFDQPSGSIDFDSLHLTYRQHSLVAPSNGGSVIASPPGGTNPSRLTDGWRHGTGHVWRSQTDPSSPQTFVYGFATPVTIYSVTIHNNPQWPSKEVEIAVSEDGDTWSVLATRELPQTKEHGANFLFHHEFAHDGTRYTPLHPNPVIRLRVTILSGYQGRFWGLGEIEAFGTGAVEETENGWYDVNQNVVVPFGKHHYRIVATDAAGATYGPDQTVIVPVNRLRGINTSGGNDLDSAWSYPPHAALDYYAAKGFTCVRIPFRWERIQPTVLGPLELIHLAALNNCVRYAVSKGLTAIIVAHNFGGRYFPGGGGPGGAIPDPGDNEHKIGDGTLTRAHFADLWGRLGAHFADLPYGVIFDLMNEPHDMPEDGHADGTLQLCAAYNEAIAAIRAHGATNIVLLEGHGWNNANAFDTNARYSPNTGITSGAAFHAHIVDSANNWFASVHNYPDVEGDEGDAPDSGVLSAAMSNVIDWCRKTGRRVFVGEFAAGTSDPNGRAVVHAFLTDLCRSAKHVLGWAWWEGRSREDTVSAYNIEWDDAEDDLKYRWLSPFIQT